MDGLLHHPMNEGEWFAIIVLVAIVGGAIVSIVKISTRHLRRMELDDIEAGLKSQMIAKGMSADDIVKVLGARAGSDDSDTMAKVVMALRSEGRHSMRARRAMHRAMQQASRGDAARA
jgi:hypothetical protein